MYCGNRQIPISLSCWGKMLQIVTVCYQLKPCLFTGQTSLQAYNGNCYLPRHFLKLFICNPPLHKIHGTTTIAFGNLDNNVSLYNLLYIVFYINGTVKGTVQYIHIRTSVVTLLLRQQMISGWKNRQEIGKDDRKSEKGIGGQKLKV